MMITLFAENGGGGDPLQEDLQSWAEAPSDDLTFPVLADPGWGISNRFEVDNGIPTYSIISRNMEILIKDGWPSANDIQDALDEEVDPVAWDQPPELDDPDAIAAYEGRISTVDGSSDEAGASTNSDAGAEVSPAGEGRSPYGSGGAAEYPGAPYGGAACSLTTASAGGLSALAMAFGLLPALRRRRSKR